MDQDLITNSNTWKEFKEALEPLNNYEEGRVFEELTRLYLLSEPSFSSKIKHVWHHSDIPQKIVDDLGLMRPEVGVDLIAQVKDGSFWAIQCKYHSDQERNVSYKELSTFLSITERNKTFSKLSHRLVCTSANSISYKIQKAHTEKIGFLTSADFSKLQKFEFDNFRKLLAGNVPEQKPFTPRPHQSNALEKCTAFFKNKKNKRGKIIHPCGSGKSLTGYWIAQKLNAKTILLVVPSLALVRQTLNTWTREAIANKIEMDWIAVCSDDDVKNSDDPLMKKVDLGIDVSTDPKVICNFFLRKSKGSKFLITTYQSGHAVSEGIKKSGKTFELGVFDEAHKTVGQKDKKFAHLLFDKNLTIEKRVFMTATERQFRGNSDEYLSMESELIYGQTIDELSFKSAIEAKEPLLSDYKIVTSFVTTKEIEQIISTNNFIKSNGKNWTVEGDASTVAAMISLRKLIKTKKIKHIVSFHKSIKRSKDFKDINSELTKVSKNFEKLSTFHVSGKNSTGERAAEIQRFIDAEPSLITNARCLTEGVDVPSIDAVLFADPKQSKIDIVQAAGRALRRFDGKDFGYIIIPIIIDEQLGFSENEAFDQIIAVISSLAMSDERIIDEYKAIANGSSVENPIVETDVPEIMRVDLKEFISKIEIRVWDRLSFGWIRGIMYLKEFVEEHGHSKVPARYKTKDAFFLGKWISHRRSDYKNKQLTKKRIQELEAIEGWAWDPLEKDFKDATEKLKVFAEKYGHARVNVTFKDKDGFRLGYWVATRRGEYKNKKLAKERIRELEAIKGWVWDPTEKDFKDGLEKLKIFVEEHGHARVPARYKDKDGFSLGGWVSNHRKNYKHNESSEKDIKELEAIKSWIWDPREKDFKDGLEKLKVFAEKYGHARVNSRYKDKDGFRLGGWVAARRSQYRNKELGTERIRELEAIKGWVWDPTEKDFKDGLEKLKIFVEEHGHARVPARYKDKDGFSLGGWVSNHRKNYKHNESSEKDIKELEAIKSWSWKLR